MRKIELFSIRHPIIFGFLLFLLFTILSTLTWPIQQVITTPVGYEWGTALSKYVIAAFFLLLLWGFGWLKTAGFASIGNKKTWLLVAGLIVYKAVFGIFAFTGNINFHLPSADIMLAILFFTLSTSLVEETMYRGLLLTVMVKAWGATNKGIYAAAVLSGLFWGSMHFINLTIRPFPVVALQVLETTISGFFYAALVLSSCSIYPAILFHWVLNASINLQLAQIPNFEEMTTTWEILTLVALPLFAIGFLLLKKKNQPSTQIGALNEEVAL